MNFFLTESDVVDSTLILSYTSAFIDFCISSKVFFLNRVSSKCGLICFQWKDHLQGHPWILPQENQKSKSY